MSVLPTLRRRVSPARRAALAAAIALAVVAALVPVGEARDTAGSPTIPPRWDGPWPESVLEAAATLPLQDGGRVKPLATWARFTLLGMSGRSSCATAGGDRISSVAWFLDAVFRPELARTHRCFLVEDRDLFDAIGLGSAAEEKNWRKRDRYSYVDLASDATARRVLSQKAREYRKIDGKERTRVQGDIVDLNGALSIFEGLVRMTDYAGRDLEVGGHEMLESAFEGKERASLVEVLSRMPDLLQRAQRDHEAAARERDASEESPALSPAARAVSRLATDALELVEGALPLALLPPPDAAEAEWYALRDVAASAMLRRQVAPEHLADLRAVAAMRTAAGEPKVFERELRAYHDRVVERAKARGEYEQIEREVEFYDLDPFGKSLVLYLIAFALLGITWLRPSWRWLEYVAWGLLWATLALHVYGIVQRCIIRGRPPISTLYETVIFITGAGVLAMLVIEHINRRRLALALAPVVGALGLFIAGRYEVLKGTDTMPELVAVLDTNFWLATHVTCISLGYCAGLLASLIAHVYVLGRVFRIKQDDPVFYRNVGRMVYGVICFALLFSLVGTILGGIWANDSWGRFWGWDPKENGALLICLTQLGILHGRMGGLFRTFGVCMGAIFGGVVVAFSWWHVNHLGIGLHSYGFTSGIIRGLMIFYGIQGAVLLAGAYAWLRDRPATKSA